MPLLTVLPLTYLDEFTDGRPAWWNFALAPAGSPPAWELLGALVLMLCLAESLRRTMWLRRRAGRS